MALVFLVWLGLAGQGQTQTIPAEISVSARVNTGSVSGDADDPAIWIHPTDPALSLVIGTDKIGDAVYVWDMNGQQRQRIPISSYPNNGDVRYGMPVSGVPVDIYVVGVQSPSRLVIFKIDSSTRQLSDITASGATSTPEVKNPYGVCLYRRASDGAYFAFVNSNGGVNGVLHQYQLLDNGAGRVQAVFVRSFGGEVNGNHSEGMVADDELGYVYISEEDCCIHKFYADPEMGNQQLAEFAHADGIEPDREGLGIYGCTDGTGYLLLSSQGNRRVKVYRREGDPGNPHSHSLVTTIYTPQVGGTDGLDVTNRPAGPNFPYGFLAKHNSGPKNFALIAWEDIAQSFLTICPDGPTACDISADFSADATALCAGDSVNFSDQSSGTITSWLWDFGDGNTSTQQNPSHRFMAAGSYTITLTASNDECSDQATKTNFITVSSVPLANFSAIPTSGNAPLTVNFTDQSTGNPTSWAWDFGDGGNATEQHPSHTYNTAGDYTVTLTATNSCGSDLETKTAYIHVEPCVPPVAEFIASSTSGNAPLTVNFTDQSTGNPTSWAWDFGDGGSATEQNPSHTYNTAGTYTVTLSVSNACGSDDEIKVDYITVSSAPTGNLALNKVATASSTYSSNAPSRAVDGSTSGTSYWRSASVSKTTPNTWLAVDLAAAYSLTRAVIRWRGNYYARQYRFQISNSGGSSDGEWTTVYTNNAGTAGTQDVTFSSPFAARYFRVRMDQNNKANNQVFELECYAGAAKMNAGETDLATTASPAEFVLEQNYPNPFNPTTLISFRLPTESEISLSIYSTNGQLIKRLAGGRLAAGRHGFVWDATDENGRRVASGVYLYLLQAGEFTMQRKLLLMK